MDLSQISKNTIERYSHRYIDFGRDIKTLGWGSVDQQEYRFDRTVESADFSNKSILDIGCGFGDYKTFLQSKSIGFSSYTGCDINPDLINEAKKQHSDREDFFVFDLSKDNADAYANQYDIGVMLGLLNFNLHSPETNLLYSELMIKNAFNLVKEVLVVDFLSNKISSSYPKEDFVFYHDPGTIVDFALSLSDNVVLKHDYVPIPQKEFMIYIYK